MSISTEEVLRELGDPDFDVLDEDTVQRIIDDEEDFYGSVARCARILANYFSLKADKSISDIRLQYQSRAERWIDIAKEYEEKGTLVAKPFFGGTDHDKNDFYRGQFERTDCDDLQGRIQ